MKLGIILLAISTLSGCATHSVDVLGNFKAGDGSDITYVRAWARAPMDIDSSVIDRYQTDKGVTKLIAHDSGFDGGWGKKTISMAVPAAIMGGSYMGGSALIRPSTISQIGGGAVSNATQSQRGTNTQGQVGINTQAQGQGQAQGQLQGQLQGQAQGQGQGQSTGAFSPVTILP